MIFKCQNMTYTIYFWIAAYYAGNFIESAVRLSENASVCGMAWRIAYWGAFFIYYKLSRDRGKLSRIGIAAPGSAALHPGIIALYAAAPAAALCAVGFGRGGVPTYDFLKLAERICVDISAAIIEELLFRGVLLGILGHTKIKAACAVIISAGLFAAAHLMNLFAGGGLLYTLMQTAFAFCAGVCLGALAFRTKSIVPAIILHTTVNLSSVIIEITAVSDAGPETAATCALAILYLAAGLLLLRKQTTKERKFTT